jgi:hypothetical protein
MMLRAAGVGKLWCGSREEEGRSNDGGDGRWLPSNLAQRAPYRRGLFSAKRGRDSRYLLIKNEIIYLILNETSTSSS